MSSWTFSAKVDVTKLLDLTRRLGSVPEMMMDVAEQVAEEVRINIRQEDIIDTGALLYSIEAARKDAETVVVHDGVSYGVYNEFGTHKMGKRPHFIPAVEKFGEIVERKFTELMR